MGDLFTTDVGDEILNKLYVTGFFSDIKLESQSNTLIIAVQERPIIANLIIKGDHAFDHELLLKALNTNHLAEGKIFDKSTLDQAILNLKSEYYNKGLYSIKITTKIVQLARNRVAVNVLIDEGDNAKIKSIKFIGNKHYTFRQLKNQMFLNTSNILSFWYKDDQYSNDKLSSDFDAIRALYLNNGYIDFKIISSQVQLSYDKQDVYLTINLSEGNQYRFGDIKISGDLKDVPANMLNSKLNIISKNTIVNQSILNSLIEELKGILGNYGYAFATITPVPDIDTKKHMVSYSLLINLDKKVYVRKININGNEKTRDVVVRRELRQNEASVYDASKIKRSKERLNQTAYYKNVDISLEPVANANNLVDLNLKVEENTTGAMKFGAGYAQGQGVLLDASISQANLFGSGKALALNASTSAISQSIGLSYTDPYALINGTSLGYDLYSTKYMPSYTNISSYNTQTIGARVRTSVPVTEYDKINFSLGFEANQITITGSDQPERFVSFVNRYGNNVNSIPLSIAWNRNTTDNYVWPNNGAIFNESFDMAAPFVGPQWYRFTLQNTWFKSLVGDLVWKINTQVGYINPYGDNGSVPFYNNYFMGGMLALRGYGINSVGVKDTDGSALGGTRQLLLTNDLLFPMPGIKDDRLVRLGLFYDIGSLWGGNGQLSGPLDELRASYGAEIIWMSPLGPIKASYGLPMFHKQQDTLQAFQFIFGLSF